MMIYPRQKQAVVSRGGAAMIRKKSHQCRLLIARNTRMVLVSELLVMRSMSILLRYLGKRGSEMERTFDKAGRSDIGGRPI